MGDVINQEQLSLDKVKREIAEAQGTLAVTFVREPKTETRGARRRGR